MKITFDAHVDFNATYSLEEFCKEVNVKVEDGIVTFEVVSTSTKPELQLKEENIISEGPHEDNLSEDEVYNLSEEEKEYLDSLDKFDFDDIESDINDFLYSVDGSEFELEEDDYEDDTTKDEAECSPEYKFAKQIASIDKDGSLLNVITNLVNNNQGGSEALNKMVKELADILNDIENIPKELTKK